MDEKIIAYYKGIFGPGIFFCEEKRDLSHLVLNTKFGNLVEVFTIESNFAPKKLYEDFKKTLSPEIKESDSNSEIFTNGTWKYANYIDSKKNPKLYSFFKKYVQSFEKTKRFGNLEILWRNHLIERKRKWGEFS